MTKKIDIEDIKEFQVLAAKSDPDTREKYLPLWVHLTDTGEIMKRLVQEWLPFSVTESKTTGLSFEEFGRVAAFLAYIHDCGKGTAVYQDKIGYALSGTVRERIEEEFCILHKNAKRNEHSPHALSGEAILLKLGCREDIAVVVGGHHGKPSGMCANPATQIATYPENYFGEDKPECKERWETAWKASLRFALRNSGYDSLEDLPRLSVQAQVLLSGLVVMADWIASNTTYFPLLPVDDIGSVTMYPKRVNNAWDNLKLPRSWSPECYGMNDAMFRERFGFSQNPVQRMVISATMINVTKNPGIYILEAQMGAGKTEAALAAAEILATRRRCGGLFMGLPTQATANGIFQRMERWAARQAQTEEVMLSIRLAHGMAGFNKEYCTLFHGKAGAEVDETQEEELVVHEWFEGRKQALLADFVIGTVDQLLMAALKRKHVFLRHLGLAGKVVIIDEVHVYDTYMNCYLDRALRWLGSYGVPVIVLSATLPEKRRRELVEAYLNRMRSEKEDVSWYRNRQYPLLTWTDGAEIRQETVAVNMPPRQIKINYLEDGKLIECLKEKLSEGGCAGVIVNTVKRAQEIVRRIREAFGGEAIVFLYHARFIAPDRAEIEREIMQRVGKESSPEQRNRVIVVGTQTLEQSLDIDFDVLVTELCPMDLLLQRIGRLHRHAFRERPYRLQQANCLILCAEGGVYGKGTKRVYAEVLLMRTKALLPETILLPDDIPQLVQEVYDIEKEVTEKTPEYQEAMERFLLENEKKKRHADAYRIPEPFEWDDATIAGWLDAGAGGTESEAEAAVRDGRWAIEVLLLILRADGKIVFLPQQDEGEEFLENHVPSEEECEKIARQRVRLPVWFGQEAEAQLKSEEVRLEEWRQSQWLRKERFLLLDERCRKALCGYQLTYTREMGLECEKIFYEEETNGREGV
ncbi:MAG: CRISPR-associated helicase Cas3' [Lachnospiraceae bacterium]